MDDSAFIEGRKTPWYSYNHSVCKTLILAAVFGLLAVILLFSIWGADSDDDSVKMITDGAVIQTCLANNLAQPNLKTEDTTPVGGPLLIQYATIWPGYGDPIMNGAILIENGKITAVGPTDQIVGPPNTMKLNVQQRVVTPGIVDLHSHAGVYAMPDDFWANQDGNEATNPLFPQVRAVDGLNPKDPAIPKVLSGGVTTALILPGSANLMGGEGTVVKYRGSKVQDLLLKDAPRALKMACGENPKRVYGSVGETPESRMGSAWKMRQKFEQAAKLLAEETQWCSTESPTTPFPRDIADDGIVALLRGDAQLHNHCYTVGDLEMMIRLSKEFGFKIAAFHHAIDTYLLADECAANNISTAIFADHGNFKVEAMDASVWASKILHDAGVSLVLKSDHPVLNSRFLLHEAQKAHYYDLEDTAAIAAITYNPAKTLGLEDRLGSIRVGLDADLVVWDRDPLVIGAQPDKVIIDGVIYLDNNIPFEKHPTHTDKFSDITEAGPSKVCPSSGSPVQLSSCYAVNQAKIYTNDDTNPPIEDGTIVVQDGIITCMGTACDIPVDCQDTFSVNGGVVVPGFIQSLNHLGLVGIASEGATQDGTVGGNGLDGSLLSVHAIDGVSLDGKFVRASWVGGISTSISWPQGSPVVGGIIGAYHLCCAQTVDEVVVASELAVSMRLGNRAKQGGMSNSISGQLAALRSIWKQARANINATDSSLQPLIDALNLRIPVFAYADSAELISALIRLQEDFGFHLIIGGGAEAHLLAERLAAASPPIDVVYRVRPWPDSVETAHTVDNATAILAAAGVRVGLAVGDLDMIRNLRWEVGMNVEWGLDFDTALRSVTSNIADMFGLHGMGVGRLVVGEPAHFLLFNGDPFSLQTRIQLATAADYVECQPRQV